MTKIAILLIEIYQKTLSLDHGPLRFFKPYGQCRYYPTCSEYTKQSLLRHGFLKGSILGLKRISSCHPWSQGGYDPVKK